MNKFEGYLNFIINKQIFDIFIIAIVFDLLFGFLRAIKERKINSCIGINGMLRKSGMIFSSLFLFLIDEIIHLNLIGFLPENILEFLPRGSIGIGELFEILYIVFEFLSILKNMYSLKIPIPKKLETLLEKILIEFTEEVKKGEEDGNKKRN